MDSAPKMALGSIWAYVITISERVVSRIFFFFFFFTKSFSKGSPGAHPLIGYYRPEEPIRYTYKLGGHREQRSPGANLSEIL
jgi:hypothetical protein